MKLTLRELRGHIKGLIIGPLFKLFEAVLELFVPLVMAGIIDIGIKNADRDYVLRGGGLLLLLGGLGVAAAMICQYYAAVVGGRVGRGLRNKVYAHVMTLSEKDSAALGPEGLITRLTVDINQVQTGVNMFIRLAVRAPFLAVGSIVMALTISPAIGLIFVVSTPLIIASLYIIMKRTLPSYAKIQQGQDELSRLSGETLSGIRVIRAFSRQKQEAEGYRKAADGLTALLVRVGRISAALNPLTSVIVNIAILVIVWMGARFVYTGGLETGQVIALVNYMSQTLLALIAAAHMLVLFTRALASARRLDEVMDIQPSISGTGSPVSHDRSAPAVEFRDVSFAYHQGADDALEHISFTIGRGQTIGLIGGTGSGKSTIAQLILRHYDVREGCILRNGVPVKDLSPEALRGDIGFVPQKASLFSGSIRRNLLMANPAATEEDMWHALDTAQMSESVKKLREGLDSVIEEGGKNLSGGQRQRMTIARALVKKAGLLILDDSSSALDYATDAALRRALAREKQKNPDLTVLIISQRVAAIKNADSILVLDDGRLLGQGTHEELLVQNEIYREICASQGVGVSGL